MAMTLAIVKSQPGSALGNQTVQFTVTVTNTSTSSVALTALSISEATESDAQVSQPVFMTPNVPAGTGNPTVTASSSVSYGFAAVFSNPVLPGPSPQNPGGASPIAMGGPPDSSFILQAQGQFSDGSIGSTQLQVAVLSAGNTFRPAEGGALQFTQGANLINGIVLGIL